MSASSRTDGPSHRDRLRLRRLARRHDRFGALLVVLTLSLVLTGLGGGPAVRLTLGLLNLLTLAITFGSTRLYDHRTWGLAMVVVGTAGAVMVSTAPFNDLTSSVGATAQAALLGVMTLAVLDRVFAHRLVTMQTIAGVVSAYLLLGQFFAWIYAALPGYFEGTIIEPVESGEVPIYFSYVVLTTLGFGDVTPVGPLAERVTVLEALTGQMYVAILISLLVSRFRGVRGRLPMSEDDVPDAPDQAES